MYTSYSSFQLKVKISSNAQQGGGLKHNTLFMKQEFLSQQYSNDNNYLYIIGKVNL